MAEKKKKYTFGRQETVEEGPQGQTIAAFERCKENRIPGKVKEAKLGFSRTSGIRLLVHRVCEHQAKMISNWLVRKGRSDDFVRGVSNKTKGKERKESIGCS